MFEKKWKFGSNHVVEGSLATKTKEDENLNEKDITYVNIDSIRPNPYQPRKQFSPGALENLCESIRMYGVMQPITVREISESSYELVAGERRLRASRMAGLTTMPVIIVQINDGDSAIMALIENIQRENLGYMEEAEAYNNLLASSSITQDELATKLGKSQSTIANKLRLLKLTQPVKKKLAENALTERHARALLKISDESLQLKVLDLVCEKGLNVKKTEDLVEKVYDKYVGGMRKKEALERKVSNVANVVKDVKVFVNTIRQSIEVMRASGVNARAAQFDRGEYIEFIVRVPKQQNKSS